jgi:hypothetical protein
MHFGPRHHPAAAGVCTLGHRHGRLAASQNRVCSRMDLLRTAARTLVRPSAAFHRQGPAAPRAGACQPIPRYARPLPAPCVRADPEPCASLDQTAASCPALSLSSLARRFRPPRVLGASRAPPAVAAERTGSLQNPCFPTQPEPMPEGADPSAPFVSPWRGLALGELGDRRDTNELLHPRADFRPHPVQPLLKTLNCPFRPRRNAFRRRLLPVDGASALG